VAKETIKYQIRIPFTSLCYFYFDSRIREDEKQSGIKLYDHIMFNGPGNSQEIIRAG